MFPTNEVIQCMRIKVVDRVLVIESEFVWRTDYGTSPIGGDNGDWLLMVLTSPWATVCWGIGASNLPRGVLTRYRQDVFTQLWESTFNAWKVSCKWLQNWKSSIWQLECVLGRTNSNLITPQVIVVLQTACFGFAYIPLQVHWEVCKYTGFQCEYMPLERIWHTRLVEWFGKS